MTIDLEELITTKQKAVQLYNDGKPVEALRTCENIVAADDRDPVVFCLMGVIHAALHEYGKSVECSQRAIELAPEYLDAHYNFALAARQLGWVERMVESLEFVLSRNPADAEAHYSLGFALEANGDYEGALNEYRLAQSLQADHMNARAGEASVYEKRGDFADAWRLIRPYAENDALSNGMMASVYGRLAKAGGESGTAVPRLERVLETVPLPDDQRLLVHFTLGALYDDIGDYARAFAHYRQANDIKGVRFDRAVFSERIDGIIARFGKARFEAAPRSDCASGRPLFVVGMMRSGTSLVEQILAGHSAVFGAGELPYMERLAQFMDTNAPDITALGKPQLNACADRYLEHIDALNGEARRVTDKMPQNFLHLGYIALLFPNARVIHCRRNAVDTCLSCYFQNFAAIQAHAFDLENLGAYYNDYRRLMAHWNEVIDIPICEVNYEDLVSDPDAEIRRILEFCGLEPEPACFRFHENKRVTRTASYGQVRKPLYHSSVERWRKYEEFIGPLVDSIGR
jgi:tetratricopeptide (TPR) repeat protein